MAYSRLLLGSSVSACALCFACSSTFVAVGSDGDAGAAGAARAGSGSGGDGTAGRASSGGSSGSTDSGGTSSAGASGAVTGNGGASSGNGGRADNGGAPAGGGTSRGGAGGTDCATLKTEYSAAVAKARVCDVGSTDECSKSSTLPALGCGCPTFVNAKSADTAIAQKRYDAIQAAKCNSGAICNLACVPATGASCAASTSGTTMAYMCTSSLAAAAN